MSIRKAVAQFCASTILTSTIVCCSHSQIKPVSIAGATCYGSATSLIDAIRRGKISAVELLDACLDRIERYNPDINAVVAMDQKSARARAAAADAALAQGEVWRPLHGLPMTVKDVFEVKGMPATSGDPLLKGHRPGRNATAVQRLLDAGAIVFGKTNAPYHGMDIQTYNEVYGTTSNPWDLTRTPGGSSGGSAAALAAGFTPLEMGSDIAGSLRFPALYAGVFGHKPTFCIVPRLGHIPPMPGQVPPGAVPGIPLFVVGPMARCADDLELALRVLATGSRTDQSNPAAKLLPPRKPRFKAYRVAVWLSDEHPGAQIDDSVMTVLQTAVKKL